jgi:hypothetical protein
MTTSATAPAGKTLTRKRAGIWLVIIGALLAYGGWKIAFQAHPAIDVSGYHYQCLASSQISDPDNDPDDATVSSTTSWDMMHANFVTFTNVADIDPETGGVSSGYTEAQAEPLALAACRSYGRDSVEGNITWMVPVFLLGLWRVRKFQKVKD